MRVDYFTVSLVVLFFKYCIKSINRFRGRIIFTCFDKTHYLLEYIDNVNFISDFLKRKRKLPNITKSCYKSENHKAID